MPVITVRALPQPPGVDRTRVCARLAVEVAGVLGLNPRRVWCTWQTLEPGCFLEGDEPAVLQPRATHPPIVDVLAFEGRPPALVVQVLERVAAVLTAELDLDEGNAFVTWTDAKAGKVFTGGQVRM